VLALRIYGLGALKAHGSAVGGVSALGSDVAELVLGQVGEVGGVGRGHGD
jgi:hypothetical protein